MPSPTGHPPCPSCDVPGEETGETPDHARLFTCYNRECTTVKYGEHGGIYHAVSDPAMKPDAVDDPDQLW